MSSTLLEKPKKQKKTYREFSLLPEGTLAQLIAGEIIMSPAPKPRHQKIVGKLYYNLVTFCREKGTVLLSPIDVYFDNHEVYQPDIIFISAERKHIIGETKIEEAPDLIVEVLSESTAYYDLKHKKNIYEAFGVKEYWVVDPKENSVEIYALKNQQPTQKYQLIAEHKNSGVAISHLLARFQIDLKELFEI